MQRLSQEETKLWLAQRGVLNSEGEASFAGLYEVTDSAIPPDSGHKTALSKAIVSLFDTDEEALLWINEYGIWPSSEDRYLFHGFRRFLGEERPLHEAPGHIFSKDDMDAVRSLVAMILYFVWGAILFSPAKGLAIKISHDEYISIYVKNQADASIVTQRIKEYL